MTVLKLKIADDNLDQFAIGKRERQTWQGFQQRQYHTTQFKMVLDGLVNHLIRERLFDYENHSAHVSILVAGNLRLVDMTDHVNMLILKREASFILIDVVSGGGRDDGLLHIAGGAEKNYNREVAKLIYAYAELNELVVEPVP